MCREFDQTAKKKNQTAVPDSKEELSACYIVAQDRKKAAFAALTVCL